MSTVGQRFMSTIKGAVSPFKEAFVSPRVAFMIPLGFASGLPLVLTRGTLKVWLAREGVDLTTIGLFSLITLIYNVKFAWAPLLDRYQLPFLGRRRGWILVTQIGLLVSILVLGSMDPSSSPMSVAVAAFIVAFFGASQDIVLDAYRTDVLRPKERASGVALWVAMYRLACLLAGAGALLLVGSLTWRYVYYIFALLVTVGMVATIFAPEPERRGDPPPSMVQSVIQPFLDFVKRPRAVVLLIIVMTYKVGDEVAAEMIEPFLVLVGFTDQEIGAAKGLGVIAILIGGLLGGGIVAKIGLMRSLVVFGVLQAAANLFYAALAYFGPDFSLLVTSKVVDNLFNGLGSAAFVAFLMSLCNARFSATQYALLSSAMSILGKLLAGGSGWLVEHIGWPGFFLLTLAVAIPALVLLRFVPKDAIDG